MHVCMYVCLLCKCMYGMYITSSFCVFLKIIIRVLDQVSFGRTTHLHFQPYRKNMDIKSHFANMNGPVDIYLL